ncbi:hypothetical protein AX15_000052 [Amanita polypyramis BW_CC]|nr:hypothetical protein AX15_000052 [Amanita polypyramis BW_CC]
MHGESGFSPKDESPKLRTSSSFIYPVKSLLSGIQPVSNSSISHKATGRLPKDATSPLSTKDDFRLSQPNIYQWSIDTSLATKSTSGFSTSFHPGLAADRPGRHSFSISQTTGIDTFSEHILFSSENMSNSSQTSPVYSSSDVMPSLPPSPTAMDKNPTEANIKGAISPPAAQRTSEASPLIHHSSATTITTPTSDLLNLMDSDTGLGNIVGYPEGDTPIASANERNVPIFSFNPFDYGFVHLSPISVPASPKANDKVSPLPRFISPIPRNIPGLPPLLTQTEALLPVSGQDSDPSQLVPEMPIKSNGPPAENVEYSTFPFQYAQDENGYHVLTGREGQLQRCEDEPIRTPGAVQAFGVLVAVEETEDALVVRQVSENSTELLGLPPSYLFSLSCFTDTLPDSQACLLWDNIRFLTEPTSTSEDEECSPHVFLLTGWGAPGSVLPGEKSLSKDSRRTWTCWCAVHRTDTPSKLSSEPVSGLIIMEFELERDTFNPLYSPIPPEPPSWTDTCRSSGWSVNESVTTYESERTLFNTEDDVHTNQGIFEDALMKRDGMDNHAHGLSDSQENEWTPNTVDIMESTTNCAKPLPALERLRRTARIGSTGVDPRRPRHWHSQIGNIGMMDIFAVMSQINEQFDAAPDLDMFLKVVVGIIKDLTQFHRVLVYQFDETWNGKVIVELMDWNRTHDIYRGLHFPASDIPAQARELYALNKVRLLYDRTQPTARLIVKNKEDLHVPLNMTHCYLRSMSPIHLKYMENMGVRASMSLSILAFGQLWGLVSCLSYGDHGMRVAFPVRQILRLLSQAISRNVERLSYAQRLHTKKMVSSILSDRQHNGYIVSNADDLLSLFDADFGMLVIGEGAKILGPDEHGQEILIIAEYVRLKQFTTIQASQAVTFDFPDLHLSTGLEVFAGLLYVPLSSGGKDFIVFLRKGQKHNVRWAGRPFKDSSTEKGAVLEPRKSFKVWSETIIGRCRAWTEEQLETAGVLSLVYGKFIEVWRHKENAAKTKKLTSLLLSNASHEVRTPLNHIINYLEMALNGPLDNETRANLAETHTASKSLLFTINDLLDLTRLESGNKTSFSEPFDLHSTIKEATILYRQEADRRRIDFLVDYGNSPQMVVGDARKIRTVVQNLTANALKYTVTGSISVHCLTHEESSGHRSGGTSVEIVVADTGCGIPTSKLETIFREFEQVESSETRSSLETGVGLGLAVVARNVEQLDGQLRVESKVGEGSCFSFLIPLALPSTPNRGERYFGPPLSDSFTVPQPSGEGSVSSGEDHSAQDLREAFSFTGEGNSKNISDAADFNPRPPGTTTGPHQLVQSSPVLTSSHCQDSLPDISQLRILVVEDNDINRAILAKRLRLNGHIVINATNGQEGLALIETDRAFDAILMDIQMPLLNGFETAKRIRDLERQPQQLPGKDASQSRRLSYIVNGHIPIFAVSASLMEKQREKLLRYGLDGWILKPIDFKRLRVLLNGVTDLMQRQRDIYHPGYNWESGGWLREICR